MPNLCSSSSWLSPSLASLCMKTGGCPNFMDLFAATPPSLGVTGLSVLRDGNKQRAVFCLIIKGGSFSCKYSGCSLSMKPFFRRIVDGRERVCCRGPDPLVWRNRSNLRGKSHDGRAITFGIRTEIQSQYRASQAGTCAVLDSRRDIGNGCRCNGLSGDLQAA